MPDPIIIPVIYTEDTSGLQKAANATKALSDELEDFNQVRKKAFEQGAQNAKDYAASAALVGQVTAELNKVAQLEATIARSRKGSYNALNAQLELYQIRLKQMTANQITNTKEGKKLTEQLAKTKEQLKQLADAQKPLNAALQGTQQNLGEMRKELLALRNTSFAGKTQAEVDAINQRIGELTDGIADLRAVQNEFGNEFGSQIAGSLQVITAGVEGVVSSLNLLGIESETLKDLQDSVVDLIAVTQALGAIEDALARGTLTATAARIKDTAATIYNTIAKKINEAQTIAVGRAEAAKVAFTTADSVASKAAAAAQWLWNAALTAFPIVAIVAGIAALVAGIVALTNAMAENRAQTEALSDAVLRASSNYAQLVSSQELQLQVIEELGKKESELIKLQQRQNEERLQALEKERISRLKLLELGDLSSDQAEENSKRLQEISDQELEALDNRIVLRLKLANAIKDENREASDDAKKRAKDEADRLKQFLELQKKAREAFGELQRSLAEQIDSEEQLTLSEKERLGVQKANALASLDLAEQELVARAKALNQEEEIAKIQTDFARLRFLTSQRFEHELTSLTIDENNKRIAAEDERLKSLRAKQGTALSRLNEVVDKNAEIQQGYIDLLAESADKELTLEQYKEARKLEIQAEALRKKRENLIAFGADENSLEVRALDLQIAQVEDKLGQIESLSIFGRIRERLLTAFKLDPEDLAEIGEQISNITGNIFDGLTALNDAELIQQQKLIDARQANVDDLKAKLDEELKLKQQGVANNYDLVQKQLSEQTELLKKEEEKRLALEKKAANLRLKQNALEIASNIALSVAKAIESNAKFGLVGVVTAAAQIASIFSLIAKAKAQAAEFAAPPKLRKGKRLEGKTHEQGGVPLVVGERVYEAEKDEWLIGTKPSREHDSFLERLNNNEFSGVDLNRHVDFSRDFFKGNIAPSFDVPVLPDYVSHILPTIRKTMMDGEAARLHYEKNAIASAMGGYLQRVESGMSRVEKAIEGIPFVVPITENMTGYMVKKTKGNTTSINIYDPPKRKNK